MRKIWSVLAGGMKTQDIRYVDQTPPGMGFANYLFRGPYAAADTNPSEWNHTALVEGLRSAAAAANVTLPANFLVGDISLLTVEWRPLVSESAFYTANPELGFFSHWPQLGTNLNASDFSPATRDMIVSQSPQPYGDYLEMLMYRLRLGLLLPEKRRGNHTSVVFYYHCTSGKDRTGQVSAAYYMQWLGMSWNDAMYYDQRCVGTQRALKPSLALGAQWYCLHLNSNSTGNCLANTPTTPSPPCTLPAPDHAISLSLNSSFDPAKFLGLPLQQLFSRT